MWFVLLLLGITEESTTEKLPTMIRVRGGQSLKSEEEMMAEHKGTASCYG